MANNNINNLGSTQSQLNAEVRHTSPASLSLLQQQLSSGASIDWFGDLNSGKSLPIEARDHYASDTPIDTIVGDIMGHLGIAK
ncbi:MAG: hypothetical protein V3U65_13540 [Granulosicoccaceae bacterium]